MIRTALPLLILSLLSTPLTYAQTSMPPNWNEADALAVIGRVDTAPEVQNMRLLMQKGDSAALLESAIAIRENTSWPAPAREFVLFSLAQSLSDIPPGLIDNSVTDYLSAQQPTVRVAHPDRPTASVPMFNIAAATAGALAEWERTAARSRANELIRTGRQHWLEAYLEASPVERGGFRVSAATYADPDLSGLADLALQKSVSHPELTVIATMAGLRLGDADMVGQSLARNRQPGLPEMMRASRDVFQPAELQQILRDAIHLSPAPTASIVIAEIAPTLLDQSAVRDLMFELLANRELGASAALVLSSSPSGRIHRRLAEVAASDSGMAAQRAGLALRMAGGDR